MTRPRIVTVTMYHTPRRRFSPRRHQGWRWTATAANGEVLAVSSESYTNRADCREVITLLFGYSTAVILRDAEMPEYYVRSGVGGA